MLGSYHFFTGRRAVCNCDGQSPIFSGPPPLGIGEKILVPPIWLQEKILVPLWLCEKILVPPSVKEHHPHITIVQSTSKILFKEQYRIGGIFSNLL